MADDAGSLLLRIARDAIDAHLGQRGYAPDNLAPWLGQPGACFVTLMQGINLRGCIGSLEAHRPLVDDVRDNAVAAATRDPRFPPLARVELARTRIEVALLSTLEPLEFADEQEALAQIRPFVHGVVFQYGRHRSTFLPQVWDTLPDLVDFMARLRRKAGLPPNFWEPGVKISRYTVTKWRERNFEEPQ